VKFWGKKISLKKKRRKEVPKRGKGSELLIREHSRKGKKGDLGFPREWWIGTFQKGNLRCRRKSKNKLFKSRLRKRVDRALKNAERRKVWTRKNQDGEKQSALLMRRQEPRKSETGESSEKESGCIWVDEKRSAGRKKGGLTRCSI